MKIHEKIYSCRKKQGLSQEALAEKLGVSRQAVSKWETGEALPDITNFAALAKVLGVTADFLLSDDSDESQETDTVKDGSADHGDTDNDEDIDYGETDTYKEETESDGTNNSNAVEFLYAIPGFLGRMLRRYGWLGGVYLAISGVMFTLIGGVAKYISGLIFGGTVSMSVNVTEQVLIDGVAVEVPSQMNDALVELPANLAVINPVGIVANVIIGIGVAMIIGGTVLAIWLKKKSG